MGNPPKPTEADMEVQQQRRDLFNDKNANLSERVNAHCLWVNAELGWQDPPWSQEERDRHFKRETEHFVTRTSAEVTVDELQDFLIMMLPNDSLVEHTDAVLTRKVMVEQMRLATQADSRAELALYISFGALLLAIVSGAVAIYALP